MRPSSVPWRASSMTVTAAEGIPNVEICCRMVSLSSILNITVRIYAGVGDYLPSNIVLIRL